MQIANIVLMLEAFGFNLVDDSVLKQNSFSLIREVRDSEELDPELKIVCFSTVFITDFENDITSFRIPILFDEDNFLFKERKQIRFADKYFNLNQEYVNAGIKSGALIKFIVKNIDLFYIQNDYVMIALENFFELLNREIKV